MLRLRRRERHSPASRRSRSTPPTSRRERGGRYHAGVVMRTSDVSTQQRRSLSRHERPLRGMRGWLTLGLLALLALLTTQVVATPVASAHALTPSAPFQPIHALPVRSVPAPDAILSAPPSAVTIWFSEALNPLDSRIIVVDPSNHEVDTGDSHVSPSDATEMSVDLQLLRPGTYVVIWRTQSAVDGHVTGGSFIFRIANADGSAPPVPATLPTGTTPGAAGFGSASQTIDAPTVLQTLCDWLALLFALFWVGGLIWEVWALPVRRAPN